MDRIIYDFDGLEDMESKFANLSAEIKAQVKAEFAKSAEIIQKSAIKMAPRKLGNLQSSIYLKEQTTKESFEYTIGSPLKYAPYVEFGTGGKVNVPSEYKEYAILFKGKKDVPGMRAQPYLIPSFEIEVSNLTKRLKDLLNAKS